MVSATINQGNVLRALRVRFGRRRNHRFREGRGGSNARGRGHEKTHGRVRVALRRSAPSSCDCWPREGRGYRGSNAAISGVSDAHLKL
jgi:hypothetical protein